jgi:hypothetical protein
MVKICGAKNRSGSTCKRAVTPGRTRCHYHGGATPCGTDSPHFKHGRYSKHMKKQLEEIMNEMEENPLDILPELQFQRALLKNYLVTHNGKLDLDKTIALSRLIVDVAKTAALIIKGRNETALTIAEVKYIQARMIDMMEIYVPDPDKRRQYIADLIALIPTGTSSSGSEAELVIIPAGATTPGKAA